MAKTLKGPIHLAVMNYNTVTIHIYQVSKEDQERISKKIEEDDMDLIVQEFMNEMDHSDSECEYMFSEKEIEVEVDNEYFTFD
jgi:hypothetical protein